MSGRSSGEIAINQVAESVAADFDEIASLQVAQAEAGAPRSWNTNDFYHDVLLAALPDRVENALDVGCGLGVFSRALADRADHVDGIDISSEMIRNARNHPHPPENLRFRRGNFLTAHYPESHFDCIASIATVHHMPFDVCLRRMSRLLRPGGMLLVLDLYAEQTPIDYATSILAAPVNLAIRRYRTGHWQQNPTLAEAWRRHARNDYLLNLTRIRRRSAEILPGARVRRHLLWRYSIIWQKPRD